MPGGNLQDDADFGLIKGKIEWNPLYGKIVMQNAPRLLRGVELEDRYSRGF
jgi:hypothetical protein